MRTCNEDDINERFYETENVVYSKSKLYSIRNYMICLDDPNSVELEGDINDGDGKFLQIKWERCTEAKDNPYNCAEDDDIDLFVRKIKIY